MFGRFLLLLVVLAQIYAFSYTLSPIKSLDFSPKKALLGKSLFFDTRLSPSGTISCERCHNLYWNLNGTSDKNIKISLTQTLNAPTVLNAAFNYLFFRDGSARDMHEQVAKSLTDMNELGSNKELILQKVSSNSQYRSKFEAIYEDGVSFENIIDAIVNFQKSLVTPNSKFDKFLQGDESALSDDEKAGFELFKTIGCINCHNGINLGSNAFYDSGALLAGSQKRVKIPSLRNIAKTAPYMYSGTQPDLKETIKQVAKSLASHELSEDEADLIYKFLLTLSGERPDILR